MTWGLKAAVRAYHIALRGVDLHVERMARSLSAGRIPVKDSASVIGALTDSLNVFSITQALTWLAGDRNEFQEQLDWKSQVYRMVEVLAPTKRNTAAQHLGRIARALDVTQLAYLETP